MKEATDFRKVARELLMDQHGRTGAENLINSQAEHLASGLHWPRPDPIQSELPPVEAFLEDLLPDSFRPLVRDVSERMQVPMDYPAIAVLNSFAGLVSRRATIQPKTNDTRWIVVPNLWGGIVAPPGFMKSPAIQAATRPLNQIQKEWRQEHEEALTEYVQEKEESELRFAAWKEQYKANAKSGKALPTRPENTPREPRLRRLIVNDSTFEALHQTMSENPAGILVVRDELTGWWSQLDRAGREGERAFCLQAWNGDTGHTIDRIGRGTIHVEACCMSMLGGIQPGRLRSYLVDALKDGPSNDGLIQRFQLLVWPDPPRDWAYVDRVPDTAAEELVESIFRKLVELDAEEPARFRFAPDAQELFEVWLAELEAKIRGDELPMKHNGMRVRLLANDRSHRFSQLLMAVVLAAVSLPAASPDMRLLVAVKHSDKAVIKALLTQRIDPNAQDVDGSTALHWVARKDDVETARALIRKGANVKAANRYGVTPLTLACINGNGPMIELLLRAGAAANTILPGGETVLMTAARTGKVDAVKALVAHGADINYNEERRGQTALMWAAAEGNTEVVAELIERGADMHAKTKGGFTPFLFAVREGRTGAVQAMLKAGADVNETWRGGRATGVNGISAMVLAVANAHYELASKLLDAGADPNASSQGWTALHQITWVRKPAKGDSDPAPEGSGNMSSLELVRKLAAKGADLNARMTRAGNVGLTSTPTQLNMIGATPFMMAARTADASLMRLFVELGADPKIPNVDGTTPLMAAAGVGMYSPGEDPGTEKEMLEAVQLALELGNDINAVDSKGETAMHGAAYKQATALVKFLAEHGARIEIWNQKNRTGWTPLRIADGVVLGANFRGSPATAEALREIMSAVGVSTVVEVDIERAGHSAK